MPAKILPRDFSRLDFYRQCVIILRLFKQLQENSFEKRNRRHGTGNWGDRAVA